MPEESGYGVPNIDLNPSQGNPALQDELLRGLYPLLWDRAAGIPQEYLQGFSQFDQPVTPIDPFTQLSLQGVENFFSGQGGAGTSRGLPTEGWGGEAAQSMDVLSQIMGSTPQDFEEFYRTNVEDPLLEAFSERLAPAAKRAGVGAGGLYSSGTRENVGTAFEEVIDAMARERARLSMDYEQANISNRMQAAGMMPSITGQILGLLGTQMGFGDARRSISEAQRQFDYGEMIRRQSVADKRLADLASQLWAARAPGGQAGLSAPTTSDQILAILGQTAGAFGQGAGQSLGTQFGDWVFS